MSEEELYAIERWVEKIERSDAKSVRKRHTPTRLMLDHINTLTAEVRQLWAQPCPRCTARDAMFDAFGNATVRRGGG